MVRSVTGDGYGYAVAWIGGRGSGRAVVYLRVGALRRAVAGTLDDCIDRGERFAHAMAQWGAVQRRARALAQGYAVLGW